MTPDLPVVEVAIVKKTNAFRRQQKLGVLKRNATLDRAARRFAKYLAQTGKFSHTADGQKPAERIAAAGYKYCRVAENLALHLDSRGFKARRLAELALNGWKNSPGHRRNMMLPTVTEIGVGVAKAAGEHRYLSVQLFARPQALRYKFEIRNETRQNVSYIFENRSRNVPGRAYIEMSVCDPGTLKFLPPVKPESAQNTQAQFKTSAGDQFVISVRNRQMVVSHRPQAKR